MVWSKADIRHQLFTRTLTSVTIMKECLEAMSLSGRAKDIESFISELNYIKSRLEDYEKSPKEFYKANR